MFESSGAVDMAALGPARAPQGIIPPVAPGPRIRVGVCLADGDRMLLVEHEKNGRRYWLVPGGGLEVGETLRAAAAREMVEETGYTISVGRLLVLCEAIEPAGRHIVNLVYSGERTGGALAVGRDRSLRNAVWQPRSAISGLTMYPPISAELLACWDEDFAGPLRDLGNVWR